MELSGNSGQEKDQKIIQYSCFPESRFCSSSRDQNGFSDCELVNAKKHGRLAGISWESSSGRSGGVTVIWDGSRFPAEEIHKDKYFLVLKVNDTRNGKIWFICNVYGIKNLISSLISRQSLTTSQTLFGVLAGISMLYLGLARD